MAGVQTNYILDLNTSFAQVLSSTTSSITTRYLPGLDVIGQQQSSQWSYFGYDGLGSVRQLTDANGVVRYDTSFNPYGVAFEKGGTYTTSLGFTGEFSDADGLLFLRARYYAPGMGTFTSRDPLEGVMQRSGSRNGYGYVEGNPVNYTDPSTLGRK